MVNGRKIREMREAKGLSVTGLAEKVYISQTAMTHIELEVKPPSVIVLQRIAGVFGLAVDDLLKEDAATT